MIERICLVLEALSIVICLHHLYGKKFKLDIATVILLAVDMIMMQAIDYYGLPSTLSLLIYPIIVVYCVVEFGFDIKKLIVYNVLYLITISALQLSVMLFLNYICKMQLLSNTSILICNCIILLIIVYVFPKLRVNYMVKVLRDKEYIMIMSLVVCIFIAMMCVVNFKKINIISQVELFQYIVFFTCIVIICVLIIRLGTYKIKSKEVEVELKMHKLYADSFYNLIDNIRLRQHEFDNHINTIYSQHYLYSTLDELIQAQDNYCQMIVKENKFNKLLTKGNPIIIGFLYGKFVEADKSGIDVSYRIDLNDLKTEAPIYKVVEILGNLINNALDALRETEKYKRLYVSIIEEEKNFTIEVRNESDFIQYNEIPNMFAKEYSEKGEGRGLGLYNVKNICDTYGFNIQCQNVEFDGCNWISFVVTNR